MEILFDTANLDEIERFTPIYPVSGVTTNPSIVKAEGRIDFYPHLRRIRQIIGTERTLHVQVLAKDTQGILDDAHRLLDKIDDQVYPKIPTTEAGLHAMRVLKDEGINVTATAIYSQAQGMLAIAAGIDYLAPYYNRMEAFGIDAAGTLEAMAGFITRSGSPSKIVAASFKNVSQATRAFEVGCQAVTVAPSLLSQALAAPHITSAVDAFVADWESVFDTTTLP